MANTLPALLDLQTVYKEQGCPSIAPIAAKAGIPSATAHRYLTGITKRGDAETIRALALALDCPEIANGLIETPPQGMSDAVMRWTIEQFQLWRENNLAELENRDKTHKEEISRLIESRQQSEKRLVEEIERLQKSKDAAIAQYMTRITILEKEKEALTVQKASKGRRLILVTVLLIILLLITIYYIVFIDARHGNIGIIRY